MAVRIDILEGTSVRETSDGLEMTRIAIVDGLTGDKNQRCLSALSILGVPQLLSSHPAVSSMKLRERIPESISPTAVRMRLLYRDAGRQPPDDPYRSTTSTVEISGALSQIETSFAFDGTAIETSYLYPAAYPNDRLAGKTISQKGFVARLLPEITMVFSRLERITYSALLSKIKLYQGKVNRVGWSKDPDAAARTWLCGPIVGRPTDQGTQYQVSYQFQYREDAWDTTAEFFCQDTGRPPDDLVEGAGLVDVQVYTEKDFNGLNL